LRVAPADQHVTQDRKDSAQPGSGAAQSGSDAKTQPDRSRPDEVRTRSRSSRRRRGGSRRAPIDSVSASNGTRENPTPGAAQQRHTWSRRPRAARRPAGPPTPSAESGAAVDDSQHPPEADQGGTATPGTVDRTSPADPLSGVAAGRTPASEIADALPPPNTAAVQGDSVDPALSGSSLRVPERHARAVRAQRESEQTA
jgi:shikimate kinase